MNKSEEISRIMELVQSGSIELARDHCQVLCKKSVNNTDLWILLGSIQGKLGQTDDSIESARRALSIDPDRIDAHFNLAQSYVNAGMHHEAITHYKEVVKNDSENYEAFNNLGYTLLRIGSAMESIKYLEKAVEYNPRYTAAFMNLGMAYRVFGDMEKSIKAYHSALKTRPDSNNIILAIGNAMRLNGQLDEACRYYDSLLEKDPSLHAAQVGKAWVLEMRGDTEGSKRILSLLINSGVLTTDLAIVFSRVSTETHEKEKAVLQINRLLRNTGLSRGGRASLYYELGPLYEQLGSFDDAFRSYNSANTYSVTDMPADTSVALMKKIKNVFSAAFMKQAPHSTQSSDRPIFIVGMPRSGTSLVERILSAHTDVFAGGELREIMEIAGSVCKEATGPRLFPDSILELTQQDVDTAAVRYTRFISHLDAKSPHVTDKMPHNFLYLGLIELMFPRARIIHVIRNPMDACLSIYFNPLSAAHNYAGDLYSIGQHYREYMSLMWHWDRALVLPILNVHYEELVTRQNETSREILSFCGLQWQERCLDFHKNKDYINTLSYKQVRKQLYASSINRWKKYDQYLSPLKEALGNLIG